MKLHSSDRVVIICMAGRYRRFWEAGYCVPKFLLGIRGKALLSHIVENLKADYYLIICNERDRRWEAPIRTALSSVRFECLFVNDTDGQAVTGAIGAKKVLTYGHLGPIYFHNCDTILHGRTVEPAFDEGVSGMIDTFYSEKECFSYVRLRNSQVVEIAEKCVISNFATSGMYGFRSAHDYLLYFDRLKNSIRGEFYISAVYERMLIDGRLVIANNFPNASETIVLGTPEEYEVYSKCLGE